MRKNEADFVTKFFSEAGTKLKNNDYFGYVQLDNYAVWAVADGFDEEEGADVVSKIAVDSAIEYFMLRPGFNTAVIKEMFEYSNLKVKEKQDEAERYSLMHTSLMIVISNYNSFLYGNVGNTRLYHISGRYIVLQSSDDTIAQLLVEENALNIEDIKYHRQRNDLLQAIGDFGKIKPNILENPVELKEGDIICLSTIGFWENIGEKDIEIELSRNTEEKWLKSLEQKIIASVRENIENYTFVSVKINRTASPEPFRKDRRKIWKSIIIAGILAFSVILALTFWNIRKRNKIMKQISSYEEKAEEEIMKRNFGNAVEEFKLEIGEYEKLKPKSRGIIGFLTNSKNRGNEIERKIEGVKSKIGQTEKLGRSFQIINEGNELFNSGNYDEAVQKYTEAGHILKENAYKREELNIDEILRTLEARIQSSSNLKEAKMNEIIGNAAYSEGNYAKARESYKNASEIYLENGRADYVSKMEKKIEEIAENEKKSYNSANLVENRADLLSQTNIDKARESYYEARKIYQILGDTVKSQEIDNKIQELNSRQMSSLETANSLVQEGLNQMTANNPSEAIILMTKAKNIYHNMNDASNVSSVNKYISQAQEFIKFESRMEKEMQQKLEEQAKTSAEKMNEKDREIAQIQNQMDMRESELRLQQEEIRREQEKRAEIDKNLKLANDLEIKGDAGFMRERYSESVEKYEDAKKIYTNLAADGELYSEKIEHIEEKIRKSEIYMNEKEGDEKNKDKNWKEAEDRYRKAFEMANEAGIRNEDKVRIEGKLKKAARKAGKKWWQFWK